jgi:hypothetical protein
LSGSEGAEQRGTDKSPEDLGYIGAPLRSQAAREFCRALSRAKKLAPRQPERAVDWCRYAASLAWAVNPGFFYCHEIEHLLAEIGRRHLGAAARSKVPSMDPPRRFLHVMSAAHEKGGHTRVVSRWIDICAQTAPSEHHSILISMQKDHPLPAWLGQSAKKTGGELIIFPPGMTWLQVAAEVRSRSLEFDVVVLHIHPNDPSPNIAFYDQPRPVLYYRHADHLFNLGLDVAWVVADFRPVGHEMSVHFCAKAPRKIMLPIPLFDEELAHCSKIEARKKLGLPVDSPIALTIGGAIRFTPMREYSFPAVVQSLCEGNNRVLIVAVGISDSEPFPGLRESVGGRFLPVGSIEDREILELYYRAADVYMDTYPNGSLTAVLDAARHSLPVQRLRNPYRCLMWSDDPALDSVMHGASTQEEYAGGVVDWLAWPEQKRSELGGRFRDAVLLDHCGNSWKKNWLDPGIASFPMTAGGASDSTPDNAQRDEESFPELGIAGPENDWPVGMFIAGTILVDDNTPRHIRIYGAFHSIRPMLLHRLGDGTTRRRFMMLRALVLSCLPMSILMPLRKIRSAIFKKPRHQRESGV